MLVRRGLSLTCLTVYALLVWAAPVNAAITLQIFTTSLLPCGVIEVSGVVTTTQGQITHIAWDWGDGSTQNMWFAARAISHRSPLVILALSGLHYEYEGRCVVRAWPLCDKSVNAYGALDHQLLAGEYWKSHSVWSYSRMSALWPSRY